MIDTKRPSAILGRPLTLAVIMLLAMVSASLLMYLPTRSHENAATVLGDDTNPNRVNITMWIAHVDPGAGTVSVSVSDIQPIGSLADDTGQFRNVAELRMPTSLKDVSVEIKPGVTIPDLDQRFGLDGTVTDYPFDSYSADLQIWLVGADGADIPAAVTVFSTDPFFKAVVSQDDSDAVGGLELSLSLARSTPTLVYATFILVLMLGLAIAAATATFYVLRERKGLVFPACSMLAAMLFALVPLRSAMPGSPPIGSLIDFSAFFIAEVVISVSLIACVLIGHRIQIANDKAHSQSP